MKAILLSMKNERRYLLRLECLKQLVELAHRMEATLDEVDVESEEGLLDVATLPKAICAEDYKVKSRFKWSRCLFPTLTGVTETPMPRPAPKSVVTREEIRVRGQKIRTWIEYHLVRGDEVSIEKIEDKYKHYEMTRASLNRYFRTVRQRLEEQGYNLHACGPGAYRVTP